MVTVGVADKKGAGSPKTRQLRPSKNPIHLQRLANLKALIKGRFEGKASKCASEIGRSHTFIWQLINAYRAIGEDSARLIERKLGLGIGTLDKKTGDAFERQTLLTAQLGEGQTQQVIMVPLITLDDVAAGEQVRRRAMAEATHYIPCPAGKCSDESFIIIVDTHQMEPRMHRGEYAVIEPRDRVVVDGKVYQIKVKGVKRPILRVAAQQDTGKFLFTMPPERKGNGNDVPYKLEDVKVVGRVVLAGREM